MPLSKLSKSRNIPSFSGNLKPFLATDHKVKACGERLFDINVPFPIPDYCGDFDIKIAKDGRWFYRNSPIERKALCRLFASVLHRDSQGCYWLVTPHECGRITVEGEAFLIVELQKNVEEGKIWLSFRTNFDEWVRAGEEHKLVICYQKAGEPKPLLHVRDRLYGLLSRAVFYQLIEFCDTVEKDGFLWLVADSGGKRFFLDVLEE